LKSDVRDVMIAVDDCGVYIQSIRKLAPHSDLYDSYEITYSHCNKMYGSDDKLPDRIRAEESNNSVYYWNTQKEPWILVTKLTNCPQYKTLNNIGEVADSMIADNIFAYGL